MSFDVVVRGGLLVDGTGRPPVRADVAVRAGRIVAVGECTGEAPRVIDATGCIVTPGFVDLHTHYDGQVSWDAELMPSSVHGVTTAVLGNCGVGFAPVHEADRETLIKLMEGVEDIPGAALAEGMRWAWTSFPEYMRAIDWPHAIDFAVQVPHDALRVYVMRQRAVAGEAATADDIESMRAHLREALEAGAVGFSTGRTDNHRSATGDATPASEASIAELEGIARAFEGLPHGVIQAVSDFDMATGDERFDAEFDVIERMASAAAGHAVSVSCMQRDMAPSQWRRILARVEQANMRGASMRVQAGARGIGVLLGFETTFHPFMGFPSYKKISALPLAARVAAMRDPAFKSRMLSETSEKVAGDGSSIPPLADVMLAKLDVLSMRLFRLGERPDYEPRIESSIYADAHARGIQPLEAIYDAMLENDGHELLYFPIFNYTEFSLDNVRTMLTHPYALPGLSDGGAHVGTVCDASFPTFMLMHWVRDRATGRIPLEQVVKMMSHDVAS
ncbi:MAG: amidohydrolase family protein, partial [Deltaproteobacteria bacterium]